ncbi:MAG: LysR family transcriptional regulator [Oscillospiraceae bacterium]|nr:LysR family transcriptional regulator [Oscillospiraceae bacterium]
MVDPKLYSLMKVYESGSFSTAAKQLSVTQPAVSQHVRALEQELNVKIFERGKGGLIVTKQGEKVIRCAQKMLGLYRQLEQELSDGRDMLDHLTVGVTHTAESNPIAEALAKYCDENNAISIKIVTMPIKNLYKMLKSYEIDIAILEDRINDPALKFLPVDTDYLVLAASTNHPFAKRSMITLNELKKERLILRLPNSGTRSLFGAHLESNHMTIADFNVVLELDNVATIKDLVRRNFGVSILPKSACLDEVKQKTIALLPIENLSMMREINIAYQSDFSQTDILRGIVDAYNETLKTYR